MNAPNPDEALTRIKDALVRGQKIEAIRLYREYTAAELGEAKTAVDRLEAELQTAEPNKFAAAAGSRDPRQQPVKLIGGLPLGCLVGAIPFVVLGAVLLVSGVRDGLTSWAFAARSERTEGTVLRLDNSIPGEGHSNIKCRPVVSYQVGGETYEVHGYVQMRPGRDGLPRGYQVGEAVPVLYEPDEPGKAVVASAYVWAGPLIPSGVGLTFVVLGIGLMWFERRKHRRKREKGEFGSAPDRGSIP